MGGTTTPRLTPDASSCAWMWREPQAASSELTAITAHILRSACLAAIGRNIGWSRAPERQLFVSFSRIDIPLMAEYQPMLSRGDIGTAADRTCGLPANLWDVTLQRERGTKMSADRPKADDACAPDFRPSVAHSRTCLPRSTCRFAADGGRHQREFPGKRRHNHALPRFP